MNAVINLRVTSKVEDFLTVVSRRAVLHVAFVSLVTKFVNHPVFRLFQFDVFALLGCCAA
jgi:hypothetical protein